MGFEPTLVSFQNVIVNDLGLDNFASMTKNIRRIMRSGHPVTKTTIDLIYHDKNYFQVCTFPFDQNQPTVNTQSNLALQHINPKYVGGLPTLEKCT